MPIPRAAAAAAGRCLMISPCLSNQGKLSSMKDIRRRNLSIYSYIINNKMATREFFSTSYDVTSRRMNDHLKIKRSISRALSSAPPYLDGDRIILEKSENVPAFDWSPPPLRVPSLTAELRQPKILKGDGVHHLVFMEFIGVELDTEQQLFHYYLQTFARAIGSDEEEAKRRIYLVSCGRKFGFGAADIDFQVWHKLNEDPNVYLILEDAWYLDRMDPTVQSSKQSVVRFNPMNLNHRLDSIFSYHHLSERNPKWNFDHWLITIKEPDGGFFHLHQVMNFYIKMLAAVVGSEARAIKSIYIVWYKFPFGFGAEIDLKTLNELRGFPDVLKAIPDFAFDTKENCTYDFEALHIFPKPRGLRFSYCRLDKEYGSEDWLISMEDHVGVCTYDDLPILRCYPNLKDKYLMNYARRSSCKHWFIIMEKPCGGTYSFQGRIDYCIQILVSAVGWYVKKKIYRTKCVSDFIGIGVNISEKTSDKLRGIHGIRKVLPDYSISESYKARSVHQLTPNTHNHLLGDIFTYHHLSECYSEGNSNHWLIHIKEPNDGATTEPQIINFCIQMLAELLGSDEHAKEKIYIVWCKAPFGFGASIDEKTLNLLKGLPNVLTVLPDRASDVTNKNRGALVISSSSCIPANRRSMNYFSLGWKEAHYLV